MKCFNKTKITALIFTFLIMALTQPIYCQNEFAIKKYKRLKVGEQFDICKFIQSNVQDYEYVIFNAWIKIKSPHKVIVGKFVELDQF